MTAASLTPTQHAILSHALDHADGRVEWFPSNIHGGARQKVLAGLAKREFIRQVGTRLRVIAAGYEALGVPHPDVGKKLIGQFETKGCPEQLEFVSATRAPFSDSALDAV